MRRLALAHLSSLGPTGSSAENRRIQALLVRCTYQAETTPTAAPASTSWGQWTPSVTLDTPIATAHAQNSGHGPSLSNVHEAANAKALVA